MEELNDFVLLKDIISNNIPNNNYKKIFVINLLKKNWKDIVGEQLYNIIEPYNIYKKKLYIFCPHQSIIQTLMFKKNEIINNIEKYVKNEISEINFSLTKIK